MGAPKGNQFWKLRSKHGRDKLFETPELLWNAACEYFQWCDDNPLKEQKLFHYQGNVTSKDIDKLRAYTLNGLFLYLDCNNAYFRQFKEALKDKTDEMSKDFSTVITRIEKTIYEQKFTGASADLLNANIISRDLGLVDRKDVKSDDKPLEGTNVVLPDGMNLDEYLKEKGL